MRVWIHSDDVGITFSSTHRILSAWEDGLIDGFSILANGPATPVVYDRLAVNPQTPARLSVHLNLSEGPCSAPRESVPSLPDREGNLHWGFPTLWARWMSGSAGSRARWLEQIEVEWRAQISRVARGVAPRPIMALDGHNHLHMLPFLFGTALGLAREYRVPQVRFSMEPRHPPHPPSRLLSVPFWINGLKFLVLRLCCRMARERFPIPRELRTIPVVGILSSGRMTAQSALAGLEGARRGGISEIECVFHVGRMEPGEVESWKCRLSARRFFSSPWRQREYEELSALDLSSHGFHRGFHSSRP